MPELSDSEKRRIERFFAMNLPRVHLLLQDARAATGPARAILWIEAFEAWSYITKEFGGYVEKLGQICRKQGRIADLDVVTMSAPNEHLFADGQEMLEALRQECLSRSMDTSAITRVMRLYQMVNDGFTLTKEQNDSSTADRMQQAMKMLQPFFANGMDPGAALTDLLATLRHRAMEEKRTSPPNVIFADVLAEFIRTAAYVRWAKQQRAEAIARQKRCEAGGIFVVPTTPEQLENDDVNRWEKVIQATWKEAQTQRVALKRLAFTPSHPVNGAAPGDWRTRVLCESDHLIESLGGQSAEVATLDMPGYDDEKTLQMLRGLNDRRHEALNQEPATAGRAFATAMESDPKTKAAWEQARIKLQALGAALQSPEGKKNDAEYRRRLVELAEAISAGLRASGDELAAQGFTPPESLEDWEHLARIVEIPLETIRTGNLTAREIHACASAWADRQKMKAKLAADAQVPAPAPPATQKTVASQTEWLSKAMLLVRDHPDWSDAEIARSVGRSPGTLSRSKEYKMAAALARGSKADRPKGYREIYPDDGTADVEAVAPPASPGDDRSDQGKPIPGSRYFREYCAECGEPIKVTQDKVGTKPLCEYCAE
jgi:hypothetical protein